MNLPNIEPPAATPVERAAATLVARQADHAEADLAVREAATDMEAAVHADLRLTLPRSAHIGGT